MGVTAGMGEGGEVNAARDGVIDFVAGAIGATVSVYVGQPLDTVKVKMQTFPHLYPNLIECTKQTLLKDGVARGLYAGTVPSLAANIGENSVLFAAYGGCQKLVARATGVDKTENLGMFANGLSGFLAAFWSSLVLCPTELVKCRLQAMGSQKHWLDVPHQRLGRANSPGKSSDKTVYLGSSEGSLLPSPGRCLDTSSSSWPMRLPGMCLPLLAKPKMK